MCLLGRWPPLHQGSSARGELHADWERDSPLPVQTPGICLLTPQSRASLGLPREELQGTSPCELFSLQTDRREEEPGKRVVAELGAQQPRAPPLQSVRGPSLP